MAKEEGENGFSERKRLKRVALAKDIIVSDSRANVASRLRPSNVVMKHHGKDILKKSQRKNRFLFSFPGLLAPLPAQGGKIGELKDLATKNPILYLHFPKVFIYFDIHSQFPILFFTITQPIVTFRADWNCLGLFYIPTTDIWRYNSLEVARVSPVTTTSIIWLVFSF